MDNSNKLQGLDLFSGYGGITKALENYVEPIAYCELEPYAQAILLSRMEDNDLPRAPIWDNVCTLRGQDLPKVDIVYGGFPCFEKGTLILTRGGFKPIEDIVIGEEVLTHKGRWRKVNQKHITLNSDTSVIKGMGGLPTRVTPEHPFYSCRKTKVWDNSKRRYIQHFDPPTWTEAQKLQKDSMLCQVLPKEEIHYQDSDFWWIVGRYIADGWLVNRRDRGSGNTCRVVICCGKHEEHELSKRISRKFHATKVEERTVFKFHISNKEFAEFLKPIGRGAKNKQIPTEWFGLSSELSQALLDGYFSGDGCTIGKLTKATTVSKSLALGVVLLIQKAYGVCASIHECQVPPKTRIEGREVNQSTQYQIGYTEIQTRKHATVSGIYGWKPIRKCFGHTEKTTVFNIGVEEDESYCANGFVVHNCQDISVAGHGKGLEGKRSGLFYEVCRLVKEIQPRFVFLENVPAIRTRGLREVVREFTNMGYDCRWTRVSAAEVGATHRRERWFLLAHSNSERLCRETDATEETKSKWRTETSFVERGGWGIKPNVGGKIDGTPFRMDRIKALGNGVVPQQVKEAFERLIGLK